jgi:predicted nucleic acid-binding protein
VIIPDASVVLSALFREPASGAAEALLRGDHVFIAPDLLLIECGNAIRSRFRRGLLDREKAFGAMDFILRLPIHSQPISPLMQRIVSLSLELDHAAYDCAYLALALSVNGRVATAHVAFAAKARAAGYSSNLISLQN